jgi:nicotinic acid mononucleotide adenylyltransferase
VLLGAFDPLTNAHLAIANAVAGAEATPAALCVTKVLLARGDDHLLPPHDRIGMLLDVAERCRIGLAFANRGTYLDVGRAMRASGISPTFAVGADKLAQLADPSFYADGRHGVDATFSELRFAVVPRGEIDLSPFLDAADVRFLDIGEVFDDVSDAEVSASEVRRLVRAGSAVDHLVPPEVARALQGYTSAR